MKTNLPITDILSIAFLAIGVLLPNKVTAQTDVKKETREISGFTKIKFESIGNATIRQGATFSVVVEADGDKIAHVITEVADETLKISLKAGNSWNNKPTFHYYITMPMLNSIIVSGVANVRVEAGFKPAELNLEMDGVGSITGTFQAKSIHADVDGAGSIILSGTTNELKGDVAGAGKVDAQKLEAKRAIVEVSGVGSFYVFATDDLNARVEGTGSIKYRGEPVHISKHVSGVGNIKQL